MTVSSGSASDVALLVTNSSQTSIPTPVIIKTGNFKIQGDCIFSSGSGLQTGVMIALYIVYLPESTVGPNADYDKLISSHPEWVLGWKYVDTSYVGNPGTSAVNNSSGFTFSSRLKRNLNSGDSIGLVALVHNAGSSPGMNLRINYGAQWWTCSN